MSCQDDCNCNTTPKKYDYHKKGCLRDRLPECDRTMMLRHVVIESRKDLPKHRDTLVQVRENNATYYVDEQGAPMMIWSGVVETEKYDINANPLGLKNQWLMTTKAKDAYTEERAMVYYDKKGKPFTIKTEETQ